MTMVVIVGLSQGPSPCHLDSVQMIRRKHVLSSVGLQPKSNSGKPQDLTASVWTEIFVSDQTV